MNELKEITQLIEQNDKIVLFHHTLPDGDSISSSYALVKALQKKFPNKKIGWIPDREYVATRFPYLDIHSKDDVIDHVDDTYLAIIGDTSVKERVHNFEEYEKAGTKICFDHHTNENNFDVNVFWHEPTWEASAIQSYFIARELEIELNSKQAMLFYYGIMTDTYRFRYSLADSLPLEASAELFKNIDNQDLADLYQAMDARDERLVRFQGWVLNNFIREYDIAYQVITKENQEELSVTPDECARVNFLANINDVKVWMFFIHYPDFVRIEFRSTGVPVNEVAKQFGGGGHIKASGAHIQSFDQVKSVVEATHEAIKNHK